MNITLATYMSVINPSKILKLIEIGALLPFSDKYINITF